MLQVQQPSQQARGEGRATRPELKWPAKWRSINSESMSQANQWVLHGELLVQARTEHLGGLGCAGVGFHGLLNLQESARPMFISVQISDHTSAETTSQINGLGGFQVGLRRGRRLYLLPR